MDTADEIDALEERIATLGEAIERCRKISFAAKMLAGGGATYLVAMLLGLFLATAPLAIAALAAVLGGLVLLGSNASTWEQTERALAAAYAARDGAETPAPDGEMPRGPRPALRVVGGERPTLH